MKDQPLYMQIACDVIDNICNGSLRPEERIPSESELMEAYHVSSITAKNALAFLCDQGYIIKIRGKGSFVSTLSELSTIEQFNDTKFDRANSNAKAIGIIMPSMKTSVEHELLDEIEYYTSQTEFMLILKISRESQEIESKAIQELVKQGVSGLIIFPAEKELYNDDILKLSVEQYPFVFIDRYLNGLKARTVTTNNYEITKNVVSRMIKKRNDNLIFISPDSKNSVTLDRVRGFEHALFDHNIPINRSHFCMYSTELVAYEDRYRCIKDAMKKRNYTAGIFCANQEVANVVANILEEMFPDNIDNIELCCFDYFDNKHFGYIQQNIPEIAHISVTMLMEAIKGNNKLEQIEVNAKYIDKTERDNVKNVL